MLPEVLELLLYGALLPETRGAVPAGLLYVAAGREDVWLEAAGLLPVASLVEAVLLVPNELLLVVDTLLVTVPDDGLDELPPARTRFPEVSRRDPLYTSLCWTVPDDGYEMW